MPQNRKPPCRGTDDNVIGFCITALMGTISEGEEKILTFSDLALTIGLLFKYHFICHKGGSYVTGQI